MTFQSTVRADQTTGIVGELAYAGPLRAVTAILDSTVPANNVIGRAMSWQNGGLSVGAGAADSDDSTTFVGILANPKTYALQGTTVGTLEPSLTLPNDTQVEVVSMGEIYVNLSTSAIVGDLVEYEKTTGILHPVAALVSGVGAIATTTLTISAITSGQFRVGSLISGPNIVPGTRITALGTGTGGVGTYTVSVSQTAASAAVTGEPKASASTRLLAPNVKVARQDVGVGGGLAIISLTN